MADKVIYRGGQHQIVCDGANHYQVDKWGRRPDGKCWCILKLANKKEAGQ